MFKSIYLSIFILAIISISIKTHSHHRGKCGFKHNLVPELGLSKPLPSNITNDPLRRRLASSSHPFKVHIDTSNVRGVSDKLREYLVDLVATKGNEIFASKIKIQSNQYIEGNSNIRRYCSYDTIVQVPNSYDTEGTDADFILFLATDDTGNDGTLAYATACYLDGQTRRPTVGFAVVNPYYMKHDSGKLDNDVATYVHEVLHALVFSSQLWKNFPKVNGQDQYFIENGDHYLRGPNLLSTVKDHFGCQSINKIPLEDDGGDGSKGGHFERIIFGDETMVSEDVSIAKFSKMTLALLKDSGWYDIDLGMGDHYTWGKGEGCDLFNLSCTSQESVEETCGNNNNFGCDKTFKYKMHCRETTFTGGCNIKTKGSSCMKNHENMYFFETAGHESRCQEFFYKGKKMAGCLEIQCNDDNQSYQVTVKGNDNTKYTCHKENEVFMLGTNFKFLCENPKLICSDLCPKSCNHRGKCLENGICACDPFFSGDICGTYEGCQGLSSEMCNEVVSSNKLDTAEYTNSYSQSDYDPNYSNYASWTDENSSSSSSPIQTDDGTSGSTNNSDSGYNSPSDSNSNSNSNYNPPSNSNSNYNPPSNSGSSSGSNSGSSSMGSALAGAAISAASNFFRNSETILTLSLFAVSLGSYLL